MLLERADLAQEDGDKEDMLAYENQDNIAAQESTERVYELAFGALKISNNGVHLLMCELSEHRVEFNSSTDGIAILKRKLKSGRQMCFEVYSAVQRDHRCHSQEPIIK
jgi:hypothetical protein